MKKGLSLKKIWQENKSFFIFLGLMLFVRAGVADWYYIPSGSMEPTIEVGDRIFVNKLAYDVKVPFTDISLTETGSPARGDIIVFDSKAANNRLIKRVVGLPGDRIAMRNNVLYLNNQPLHYSGDDEDQQEQLGEVLHQIHIDKTGSPLSSFDTVTVPEHHVLVLGDNRNNSADSRVHGFIPMDEIIGKASHIAYSLDNDNAYMPRIARTFQALE
ncbi:signal peptidase I [Alteromonas confluentis]|uniref:Signal peptidase I n=1 Tax=Alteromonas confluentis TaxID=1656094 RepID=A0A1E7ZC72_9ALTE|nr:signal peptidase I [Alteromonas confluentis]OFC71099.1 signal peptidase I [Alteromonas confluentis]